jgi:hypothetical protein
VTARRATACVVRALIAAIWAGAGTAMAQSYSVNGQAGYLQEWEIKANVAKTVTGNGVNYDGAATLRHVGLCSVNEPEEKSAVMRLTVSRKTAAIEGTLTMTGDTCRIAASAEKPHAGLLNCRDGQGVPIRFSIDEADAGRTGVRADK